MPHEAPGDAQVITRRGCERAVSSASRTGSTVLEAKVTSDE